MHFTGQHEEQKRGNQFPWEAEGDVECPTCGRLCANEAGMRRHHTWVHDESLARVERTCRVCGDTKEMYESKLASLEHDDLCVDCARRREIPHTEETKELMSEIQQSKEFTEEDARRLEEARELFDGHTEEAKKKIGEASRSRSLSDEARRKISETLQGHDVSEKTREKIRENSSPGYRLQIDIDETGHTVRSHWEEELDLLLHESGVDYEYEPETFDIGFQQYTPDFRITEYMIEVKGYAAEDDKDRARAFLDRFPEYTYVAVGSWLPSDIHISWESRRRVLSLIK